MPGNIPFASANVQFIFQLLLILAQLTYIFYRFATFSPHLFAGLDPPFRSPRATYAPLVRGSLGRSGNMDSEVYGQKHYQSEF